MILDDNIKTPYYLIDIKALEENLKLLRHVKIETDCKILLAQKAFSMYSLYPLIGEYLDGTTASGLNEAKLGFEEMKKENHIFSPAYKTEEFDEITDICDHIVFNSFSQMNLFKDAVKAKNKQYGLRVNPEHSTQCTPIYDPCAPYSRFGATKADFYEGCLLGADGLHFHTLCEQGADALEETLAEFEKKFSNYFKTLKWINFGGGHHITKKGYDVSRLIRIINGFKEKYNLQVYLEPGEAVVLNCGYLISTVLDIVKNDKEIAILDTSAACHMPDVIEMPYRPPVLSALNEGENKYDYRLACATCLAGDVIGDYSFRQPLRLGDKVIFGDMALYTMVKNNTFNGINLPSIVTLEKDGSFKTVRSFSYADFKSRL